MSIDRDGFVYEMNPLSYQVRKYGPEGVLIKTFTNPAAGDVGDPRKVHEFLNGPFCLDDGVIVIQRKGCLDLFDSDGRLITSGILAAQRVIYVSRNDLYFEVSDEGDTEKTLNPRLVCYRLRN